MKLKVYPKGNAYGIRLYATKKETHHLGANGTVHMDAGVTMYLPKGSECPQRIGFAHIQDDALWLQTYAKMTYMIPIEMR